MCLKYLQLTLRCIEMLMIRVIECDGMKEWKQHKKMDSTIYLFTLVFLWEFSNFHFTPPIAFATFRFALNVLALATPCNTLELIFALPNVVSLYSKGLDGQESDYNKRADASNMS